MGQTTSLKYLILVFGILCCCLYLPECLRTCPIAGNTSRASRKKERLSPEAELDEEVDGAGEEGDENDPSPGHALEIDPALLFGVRRCAEADDPLPAAPDDLQIQNEAAEFVNSDDADAAHAIPVPAPADAIPVPAPGPAPVQIADVPGERDVEERGTTTLMFIVGQAGFLIQVTTRKLDIQLFGIEHDRQVGCCL